MSDDDTKNTQGKHSGLIPWKPGQSGNPKGKPKGSRHKINELFLQDFFEAWEALGRPALLAAAWKDPVNFVKVAASLLPKEFKFETTITDLTDEQLKSRIRQLASQIGDGIGDLAGTGRTADRAEAPPRPN